ncbi:hypothetical protein DX873_01910 [Flagellimonas nanhaiensis]|uniref:Periplasmic heavy metal sensor n=2 Tax=Flagellimonas nanhaiensis TaxID=2292706 RepID=A0A371JT38_9FLAO|nr:hypothetical protein DX873_01910 [Allomuricauda nanhaiensis]
MVFFNVGLSQEDCQLGVGGQDDQVIMEVFQLNDNQKDKLKSWSAELKVRNDILKDRAKHLLKRHEGSSPEVLMTFSKQYKDILDSMKQNALMMDRRLLSTLNAKQYNLYLELCSQLTLRPMYVDRSVDEK